MRWRYATQRFDPARKIPRKIWETLEQVLVLTPSSYGLQPWKFFVVDDPALRKRLRAASWDQSQITDASHMVVFARKKELSPTDVEHYIERIAQVRKIDAALLRGFKQTMLGHIGNSSLDLNAWSTAQVYIALGNFLTSAAMLGIDTCPMGGIDPPQYDKILGIAKDYRTLCVATAGYRAKDDAQASKAKVRFPVQEVIEHK